MRPEEQSARRTWQASLAAWFAARTTLLLTLLMLQLGLLLALVGLLSAPAGKTVPSTRGAAAGCGAFEVIFAPATDLLSLRQWALNFDAQVLAGPNARGAFEIALPRLDLAGLRQSLGPLAEEVRSNPLCPAETTR